MAPKTDNTADEGKKSGMLKMIIIAVVVILLLAGVGIGAYFLGSNGGKEAALNEAKGQTSGAETDLEIGPMVAMDDFIVNIIDAEETRYLKISMTLELSTPETSIEIEERKAQVRDTILLYLSSKTFDEIRDMQGKLQMRADLVGSINSFLAKGKVKTIYFTDFMVQ
jgi:flagellar protein FliL